MTREEKLKLLLDTGEYDFIKYIPKENMWKLIFALAYIEDTIPMSDIDGIKAEIETEISDYEGCADFYEGIRFGLRVALEIIDKHIKVIEGQGMNEIDFIQPKKIVGKLISVDMLDKIRDEIANEKGTFPKEHYIRIIDKYKAESEDKE